MGLKVCRFFCQQSLLVLSLLSVACGGSDAKPAPVNTHSSASAAAVSSSSSSQSSAGQLGSSTAVPTNLHSNEISATQVTLAWDAVPANGESIQYRVTRNGKIIAITEFSTYTDSGLHAGQQYLYRVQSGTTSWSAYTRALSVRTALDDSTAHSSSSAPGTPGELPPDNQPPSVPSRFQASNIRDTRIDLIWQAAHDNVGVSVYEIYRDGALVATISGSVLAYLDQNLAANTRYSYTLRARDKAGNVSAFSLPLDVQTTSPSSSKGIKLVWQHPQQRENGSYLELADIGGYELRYRQDSLNPYTVITIPGNATTHYSSATLSANWDYEIAVYDRKGLYSTFVMIKSQ